MEFPIAAPPSSGGLFFQQLYRAFSTEGILVCDIIMCFINRYRLNMLNSCYEKHSAFLAQKSLQLDYAKAESSAVKTLRGKVAGSGSGIAWVCDCLADIISASVSVIIAIITVNGMDIKEFDYKEYMKLFAIVFQDYSLLAFPIGEVVACSEQYDEKFVWRALDGAGLKQRVENFPNKLNTAVYKLYDKSGIDLSGGEAQKTAIARALYRDALFMILDEPTAALDPIAESEIYERFSNISGDKTSIFVSHRLSSCRFCSRIIVFDKGEIIQQGTHEHLLEDENGKYSELWSAQAQYYAENVTA